MCGSSVSSGPRSPAATSIPASIEELANGDLYIAYYGGDGEYAEQTAVYGMRLKRGETKWSTPKIIADTPFHSMATGVIWQAPDGVVWLFYVCRFGDTWSTSRVKAKLSHDGAETWSDSFMVALEEGMMVRGRQWWSEGTISCRYITKRFRPGESRRR